MLFNRQLKFLQRHSTSDPVMNSKPEESQPDLHPVMNSKPEETQPGMNRKPEETQHISKPEETQPGMNSKPEETQPDLQHQPPPSSSTQQPQGESHVTDQKTEKWGTHIMGTPAPPSSHPNNQKAALWSADQQPYIQYSPVDQKPSSNPIEPAINVFNSWSHKAETLARSIWQNLKTGTSVSDVVYGKVGLSTKVITGGGFESLYRQTFSTPHDEKLKKTFACYLSTSTGPVAGTMYLSNVHVAFCSDRPLSFTAPSGQAAWSYYKVMIPLAMISSINPINMKENPPEKYIQITTVDHHDFWFMGFVNYDKASLHLSQSLSEFISTAAQPVVGSPVVG